MGSAIGIAFGLAFGQPHMAFSGKKIGQELADQEKDQPDVNHPDADFFSSQFEPLKVRRHQIDEENTPEQIAAGKDGNFPGRPGWRPINKETAEKFVLGFKQAELDLRKSSPKDQH